MEDMLLGKEWLEDEDENEEKGKKKMEEMLLGKEWLEDEDENEEKGKEESVMGNEYSEVEAEKEDGSATMKRIKAKCRKNDVHISN